MTATSHVVDATDPHRGRLQAASVTVLVFLSGAAWTRIVPADSLLDVYRHLALLLTSVGYQIGPAGLQPAHIRSALLWSRGLSCF